MLILLIRICSLIFKNFLFLSFFFYFFINIEYYIYYDILLMTITFFYFFFFYFRAIFFNKPFEIGIHMKKMSNFFGQVLDFITHHNSLAGYCYLQGEFIFNF